MKSCVIFDTRYGNTAKVARALGAGLSEAGLQTDYMNLKDATMNSLDRYDLICVGGPTQYRTASEEMVEFLESLARTNLSGRFAFAFDTRRDSVLAGSAAKYIEGALQKRGMKIVSPRASAIMVGPTSEKGKRDFEDKDQWKEWRHRNEGLLTGEEARFRQLGNQVGKAVMRP